MIRKHREFQASELFNTRLEKLEDRLLVNYSVETSRCTRVSRFVYVCVQDEPAGGGKEGMPVGPWAWAG